MIPYQNNPSVETIFESNKIKEQHETLKLQNEEVMLSHLKPWLMNWTDQQTVKWETSQKKNYLNCSVLTLWKSKYFVSYTINLLWLQGDVMSREQEIVTK